MTKKKSPNLKMLQKSKNCSRTFCDPHGYEEILYRLRNNRYVLAQRGGVHSPFPEESIQPILKKDAMAWMESH